MSINTCPANINNNDRCHNIHDHHNTNRQPSLSAQKGSLSNIYKKACHKIPDDYQNQHSPYIDNQFEQALLKLLNFIKEILVKLSSGADTVPNDAPSEISNDNISDNKADTPVQTADPVIQTPSEVSSNPSTTSDVDNVTAPTGTSTVDNSSSKSIAPGSTAYIYWAQNNGDITPENADVVIMDSEELDKETVDNLKAQGKQVVAYISAGSREDWRGDKDAFPADAVGNDYQGWPGENWLNINDPTVRQVMENRIDQTAALGVDGIEFDNVDEYTANSGFPLTEKDQVNYIQFLAAKTHEKGMLFGLKNAMELIPQVADFSDFAINEEGFEYGDDMSLYKQYFVDQGKAVFNVEYSGNLSDNIEKANALGIHTQMGTL